MGLWFAKAEVVVGGLGLIVPVLAQNEITTSAITQWMQFGLAVVLVLIHTLWTMPQMRKEQADERAAFMAEMKSQREAFVCKAKA